jgi:hypothetical protein
MERIGNYFVQITHFVYLNYEGNKYKRQEDIINGKVFLQWCKYYSFDYNDNKYNYVTNQKDIDKLNKAYADMSYQENFKKD